MTELEKEQIKIDAENKINELLDMSPDKQKYILEELAFQVRINDSEMTGLKSTVNEIAGKIATERDLTRTSLNTIAVISAIVAGCIIGSVYYSQTNDTSASVACGVLGASVLTGPLSFPGVELYTNKPITNLFLKLKQRSYEKKLEIIGREQYSKIQMFKYLKDKYISQGGMSIEDLDRLGVDFDMTYDEVMEN